MLKHTEAVEEGDAWTVHLLYFKLVSEKGLRQGLITFFVSKASTLVEP
jgi:hypothetical protein